MGFAMDIELIESYTIASLRNAFSKALFQGSCFSKLFWAARVVANKSLFQGHSRPNIFLQEATIFLVSEQQMLQQSVFVCYLQA